MCQEVSLTQTACLPWKWSFCVQSSSGNQFLLSPLPPKAGLMGLCFSYNLSNPPTAFHYWIPSVSCVICVTITNSHPIDLWRKEVPQNHLPIFFNIQTSRKRRGKTHLWIELFAPGEASLEKNMEMFIPDSAFFFPFSTFLIWWLHSSPCKCFPCINVNGSRSCVSRGD